MDMCDVVFCALLRRGNSVQNRKTTSGIAATLPTQEAECFSAADKAGCLLF